MIKSIANVIGVFKNLPIPKNLISLSPIIMVCECPALLLVGFSYIKREQSTQFISLIILVGPSPHFSFINKRYVHSWHVTHRGCAILPITLIGSYNEPQSL